MLHDMWVPLFLADSIPVGPGQYRDRSALDSAVARPFQTAFGQDIHPSITNKAAALFHSLNADHPFINGNKRTSVVALDHFLMANGYFLAALDQEMYGLATDTAMYKERGVTNEASYLAIVERLEPVVLPLRELPRAGDVKSYRVTLKIHFYIRRHPLNGLQPYRT